MQCNISGIKWEENEEDSRFAERAQTDFRFAERAQTDYGVSAVLSWAKEANLGPEVGTLFRLKIFFFFFFQDLFISGDVDEVLSRGALHQLKWCQVREDVITGGKNAFVGVKGSSNLFPFLRNQFCDCKRSPLDATGKP